MKMVYDEMSDDNCWMEDFDENVTISVMDENVMGFFIQGCDTVHLI